MEELNFIPETRPQPKFTLLTFGQYFKLNHDLSIARGWKLGQPTERTFEMSPPPAKVNITYDEEGNELTYDIAVVMPISSEIQENHADLIAGIELHKDYIPVEEDISEWIAEGLKTAEIDWELNHCAAQKVFGKVIWMESEPRTSESDEAVQVLNELDNTIITVEL